MRREGKAILFDLADCELMFAPLLTAIQQLITEMDDENLDHLGRSVVLPITGSTLYGMTIYTSRTPYRSRSY